MSNPADPGHGRSDDGWLIDPALGEALDDLERLLKRGADVMRETPAEALGDITDTATENNVDEHGQASFLPRLTPAPIAERAGGEDALPPIETGDRLARMGEMPPLDPEGTASDLAEADPLPPLALGAQGGPERDYADGLDGDPRLDRVIERLVSEVDIIASECVHEVLSEVEARVQARVRERIAAHLRIVLPELIDDMSRLD